MGTQIEVARLAGVSQAVVSAVINGTSHTRVSEETRRRVLRAIDELGYVPNSAARALRSQRAGSIAVVATKLDNPVYRELFHGIYEEAERRGWAVVVGDMTWMRRGSHILTRLLGRGAIDGIIVREHQLLDDEVLGMLQERPAPVVLLERCEVADGRWLSVDDHRAGQLATQRLLELGHRRIVYVGGDPANPSAERYRGYVDALTAAGLPRAPHLTTGFGLDAGRDGLERVLADEPEATGLVINNVMTGIALLGAAQRAGVDVPGRLSMIAIHDAPIAEHTQPRLTTVELPMRELGSRAVQQIAALIEDAPTQFGVVAEPEPRLVLRESDAPLPG